MIKLVLKLACFTFIPLAWCFYWLVGQIACWLFHMVCWAFQSLFNLVSCLGTVLVNVACIWPETVTCTLLNKTFNLDLAPWQYCTIPTLTIPNAMDYAVPHGWVFGIGIATYALVVLIHVIEFYADGPHNH